MAEFYNETLGTTTNGSPHHNSGSIGQQTVAQASTPTANHGGSSSGYFPFLPASPGFYQHHGSASSASSSASQPERKMSKNSSSLSMARAAFLLIRVKRVFQKKKRNKK